MRWKILTKALGVGVLFGGSILAACSSGGGATPEGAAGPGELADEALVTYTAANGAYSFQHPKSWTEGTSKSGGIQFAGRDAFVAVDVISAAGGDVTAFVTQDKAKVEKSHKSYSEISLKASTEVQDAVILTFEWDAGDSTVTGKPVHAHVDRYYIPVSGGRIAIMTGSEPASLFDRETIRDVALSVKVK